LVDVRSRLSAVLEVGSNRNMESPIELSGTLHFFAAFDWGEEVNLDQAQKLVRLERYPLPRRRRTPSSIAYRPLPLQSLIGKVPVELPELGKLESAAEATVFDFAAVSVALRIPFRLSADCLRSLASHLADPAPLVKAARAAVETLHRELLPAITAPRWNDFSEEYFVFEIPPAPQVPAPSVLLGEHAGWLAGLVRLEAEALSSEEIQEATRLHLRYGTDDLLVADWAASVLVDRDCDETLEVIEFANLQLLEFRDIDSRLDDRLAAAYGLIRNLAGSWLPFWKSHTRSLRALGEMKVEANTVFERTSNVLKLVGDQYLARVYRLLSTRYHLDEWERSVERSLAVVESVYQVLAQQAGAWRMEFLELIVIFLIGLEIVMAFLRH
jgi:hypothetical protein